MSAKLLACEPDTLSTATAVDASLAHGRLAVTWLPARSVTVNATVWLLSAKAANCACVIVMVNAPLAPTTVVPIAVPSMLKATVAPGSDTPPKFGTIREASKPVSPDNVGIFVSLTTENDNDVLEPTTAVSVCVPSVSPANGNCHAPVVALAVTVPTVAVPFLTVTVAPAVAVPVKTGIVALVIPSPVAPESVALVNPVMATLGFCACTVRATEVVAVLPAESVILTV